MLLFRNVSTKARILVLSALLSSTSMVSAAQAAADFTVKADAIGGVVTSANGPEAGVWVIAQTSALPTRLTKIVVTDDEGRFLVPGLPNGTYKVWVRGYGLVDSEPTETGLGKKINLKAVVAPNETEAAQYYPANYWWSLMRLPGKDQFPGTGPKGNGIPPNVATQQRYLAQTKQCVQCHQFGNPITRNATDHNPELWDHRVQMTRENGDLSLGDQAKGYTRIMNNAYTFFGRQRAGEMLADWTKRIADGALPPKPPRPAGIERNIVLTLWSWGAGSYFHDEVSSDRRDPTVNADGPIYGTLINLGKLGILDPKTGSYREVEIPDGYQGYVHTVMMDQKKRVWMPDGGSGFQPDTKPKPRAQFCTDGARSKFAKYFPLEGPRGTFTHVYDPADGKITTLPSCYGGGHNWFGSDPNNTLYITATSAVGWIDTKVWDETKDSAKAHGWCPLVVDTSNDGDFKKVSARDKIAITPDRSKWGQYGRATDPAKDMQITGMVYGLGVNAVDNTAWGAISSYPGGVARVDRGANPPETCRTEFYEPPQMPGGIYRAYAPHDLNFDSTGMAWVSFTSGQMGRFDRNKCEVMRGPAATGQHCQQGWKIYDSPGVKFAGVDDPTGTTDILYQTFVDRFGAFGLGRNVPMFASSNSDSIVAFLPEKEEWVRLRVPYPMGFYTRWMDGRIDDPNGDWKRRGGWATFSTVPTWHQEEEYEANPELVKFQFRPHPLAD